MAYILIVGSQITVSLGIARYFTFHNEPKYSYSIIGGTNLLYLAILVASETVYRIRMNNETPVEVYEDIPNIT